VRKQLSRFVARAKQVLLTDPEDVVRDEVELAGALEQARAAARQRAAVAKAAQLAAYIYGPGAAMEPEARAELARLFDDVPADSPERISQVIEEDLGASPDELFVMWEDEPFAAASLGQVHRAVASDGATLAVKVQYPGVSDALREDLQSAALVRDLIGATAGRGLSDAALEAVRLVLEAEVDYLAEAENLGRFARAFADDGQMVFPAAKPKLSSTRILTMDFVEGQRLADFCRDAAQGARDRVAETLFRFGFAAPLCHGLVNVDPNPGNYLVVDGAAGTVGLLDFGCVSTVDAEVQKHERTMWRALLKSDLSAGAEEFRYALYEMGLLADMASLHSANHVEWEKAIAGPIMSKKPFRWTREHAFRLIDLTGRLLTLGGLSLSPELVLLWRARLGLFSVLGELEPEIDFRGLMQSILD
jgi:predicted unusual protein kinase regulating ubiquinone biosynthesis (AarF/ABC1/UbiB family)